MTNLDVKVAVILSISLAAGIASGLYALRFFRAETEAHRLFVFWPTFWIVSVVVFFGLTLLAVWMFDLNQDPTQGGTP